MERVSFLAMACSGLMFASLGCGGAASDYKPSSELKKAAVTDHHEHEKGPHGGSLVELGEEEFHGEIILDHDAHTLRVLLLGKDAKTAAPSEAKELTVTPAGKAPLTLKAVPLETDGEGKSSRFELVDEDVVHKLMDEGSIHGTLNVSFGDKPYSGEIDYHLEETEHVHKDMPAETPAAGEIKEAPVDAKPVDEKPAEDKPVESAKE